MIHLEPRHLELVKKILLQHVPDCTVWVFGSRVSGIRIKPFSDLDLAIICQNSTNSSQLNSLKEAFTESDLPIKVDIINWDDIDDAFKSIIKNQHEPILLSPSMND